MKAKKLKRRLKKIEARLRNHWMHLGEQGSAINELSVILEVTPENRNTDKTAN